ncbi:hypothetical protein FVQ98_17655 [Ottowia sp. GY511]|uniref:YscD/Y4YQ C-terminal domain-containing protein n=1 Tax=Ottowia flava TaxID=2675430 RepID=A0ABW4KX33_9BURK|nr:hypothetical protein [Ottowia sp. GY511]TXK23283.1 hypothetical protein FVQ98_17655 [Ottowia sp. GY511]
MKTTLYELRVLNGEQRGATSAVRPGDTLRIGREWSNDVVVQDAGDSVASILLRDDGSLALGADGGDCSVDGAALETDQPTEVALYTPFTVGGTCMAVGRIGASQWGALFGDTPVPEEPAQAAPAAEDQPLAAAEMAPAPARKRGGLSQRLLTGGAALVAVSACALTMAWAMGPGTLKPAEQVEHLRQTLAHLGYGMLDAEHRDGQLVVKGYLDTVAQRSRLEQALAGQSPARLAVTVNEQVTASVADVYRLNGISADVKSGGPGVVQVHTREADQARLDQVQARARRDVPGLSQIVASNDAPPVQPRPEATISDPGKRVAAIVPGEPAYVVTADGTRYFEGAVLPTGHRILAILSDRVQIERDGAASTLNF